MNLNKKVTKELKRLGANIVPKEVDVSNYDKIDFKSLPKSYYELLFCIEWPDKTFSQLNIFEGEIQFEESEIDWNDEDLHLTLAHVKVTIESYESTEVINTFENFDNFGNRKYVLIGNVDDNYCLVLNLSKVEIDGDPEVHIIYPYEPEDENIYDADKLSNFLKSLIINKEEI